MVTGSKGVSTSDLPPRSPALDAVDRFSEVDRWPDGRHRGMSAGEGIDEV
jgi:hypothetical protein